MHVTSISSEIDWSRLQHVQRATKANERNMCLSLRPSARSHLLGIFASANDHRFHFVRRQATTTTRHHLPQTLLTRTKMVPQAKGMMKTSQTCRAESAIIQKIKKPRIYIHAFAGDEATSIDLDRMSDHRSRTRAPQKFHCHESQWDDSITKTQ
eukprot:TRINITY_DN3988_c0_g1_i3.p1 TRINITY_DN3988_c0_g1~~TRINITY_DN3988_c0_g1_i3.p1  ORF type:complete len:154 (-),score=0.26 TRINITY_DN3988_c0_g1_i3:285-746(-)